MLNMFRAPLCPSSGAQDDSVGYHICSLVLELLLVGSEVQEGWMSVRTEGCNSLRSGHSSILPALNFQPAVGSDSYSLRSGHSSILPALNFQPAVGSDSYSLRSGHSSILPV